MIFPFRTKRDVLYRAVVAVVLILAVLILGLVTSIAEPAPGRSASEAPASQVSHIAHLGAGRPAGCPRLWCGCWARIQAGLPKRYNLALNWLDLPHTSKHVGAWAVMRRRGGGHVGRVVAIDASGNPVLESGNHGHRVGVGTYPARRIVAYVVPR